MKTLPAISLRRTDQPLLLGLYPTVNHLLNTTGTAKTFDVHGLRPILIAEGNGSSVLVLFPTKGFVWLYRGDLIFDSDL